MLSHYGIWLFHFTLTHGLSVDFSVFEAAVSNTAVQVMCWQIFILTSTFGKNLIIKSSQVLHSNNIGLMIPNACASLPNNKEI